MSDETQKAEEASAEVKPTEEKKSFMDRQFANMSGCGFVFICLLFPAIALLLGIVGLIACKDTKARERATNMTIFGGVVLVICVIILFAQIGGH